MRMDCVNGTDLWSTETLYALLRIFLYIGESSSPRFQDPSDLIFVIEGCSGQKRVLDPPALPDVDVAFWVCNPCLNHARVVFGDLSRFRDYKRLIAAVLCLEEESLKPATAERNKCTRKLVAAFTDLADHIFGTGFVTPQNTW